MKKIKELDKEAALLLLTSLHLIEGQFSGIPDCCVKSFASGMTGLVFKEQLSKKDQAFYNTHFWEYIPCMSCFKKKKRVKLKHNGTSIKGRILREIIRELEGNKQRW